MMLFITGGSGSGKSAYAEERLLKLSGEKRIYLATMIPQDDECRKRILRHRKMREKKGFETIEQYRSLEKAAIPPRSAVLLECVSNLTANEMFGEWPMEKTAEWVVEKVVQGVKSIKERADNLVVVTNEVFSDGTVYDEGTQRYLEALGKINRLLATMADEAEEVVWGIPVRLK